MKQRIPAILTITPFKIALHKLALHIVHATVKNSQVNDQADS
jgi:hypothetical protein